MTTEKGTIKTRFLGLTFRTSYAADLLFFISTLLVLCYIWLDYDQRIIHTSIITTLWGFIFTFCYIGSVSEHDH